MKLRPTAKSPSGEPRDLEFMQIVVRQAIDVGKLAAGQSVARAARARRPRAAHQAETRRGRGRSPRAAALFGARARARAGKVWMASARRALYSER